MTSISQIVYIDKLDDIVDEYNNTYRTIEMKPIDVKDNAYINFEKESNNKDPKFKIGDHVKISKFKTIFAKGYMPNWSDQKEFRIENVIRKKGGKLYVKWKGYDNSF